MPRKVSVGGGGASRQTRLVSASKKNDAVRGYIRAYNVLMAHLLVGGAQMALGLTQEGVAGIRGAVVTDLCGYGSARELFAAVRDAALEGRRAERTLERMRAAEGVRAQGYEPRVSGGGAPSSGMGATDARMDQEARLSGRLEQDRALLDLAGSVIYGADAGRGGVDALMGSAVADAMWWRYCAAEGWGQVADRLGYSVRQTSRLVDQGTDAVDFFGVRNCACGVGMAE